MITSPQCNESNNGGPSEAGGNRADEPPQSDYRPPLQGDGIARAALLATCANRPIGWPTERHADFEEAARVAWTDSTGLPKETELATRPHHADTIPPSGDRITIPSDIKQAHNPAYMVNTSSPDGATHAADNQASSDHTYPHMSPGRLTTPLKFVSSDEDGIENNLPSAQQADSEHSSLTHGKEVAVTHDLATGELQGNTNNINTDPQHGLQGPGSITDNNLNTSATDTPISDTAHRKLNDIDWGQVQANNEQFMKIFDIVNSTAKGSLD